MKISNKFFAKVLAIVVVAHILVTPQADVLATEMTLGGPVYDTALESVGSYNKIGALRAAIKAVDEQLPEVVTYWDMSFGANEVQGKVCGGFDHRGASGIGCAGDLKNWLTFDLAVADGVIQDTAVEPDTPIPSEYAGKTFHEILALAKNNSAYGTNSEFKQRVDDAEIAYQRGVESLRAGIALIDPTQTGLDTKNGDELLSIYENLPAVKAGTYQGIVEAYNGARAWIMSAENMGEEKLLEDYGEAQPSESYARLVATATTLDPNFTVDLSNVTKISGTPQNIPIAPDTGDNDREELSATMVAAAVIGVASIATVAGGIFTAKRFLFSPLKKRK